MHQRLCSTGTAKLAHTRCAAIPPAPHMCTPQHPALETAHPVVSSLEIPGTPPNTPLLRPNTRLLFWAVNDRLSSQTHSSLLSFPLLSAASKPLDVFKDTSCKKKFTGCHHLKQKSDFLLDIHFKTKCQLLKRRTFQLKSFFLPLIFGSVSIFLLLSDSGKVSEILLMSQFMWERPGHCVVGSMISKVIPILFCTLCACLSCILQ